MAHGFVDDDLTSPVGERCARGYAAANATAVERVAELVESHDIGYAFERLVACNLHAIGRRARNDRSRSSGREIFRDRRRPHRRPGGGGSPPAGRRVTQSSSIPTTLSISMITSIPSILPVAGRPERAVYTGEVEREGY
jgi:hypothetical protein